LAEKHGLQTYHYDLYDREAPPGHWSRADPKRHPHMAATPTQDRDWMWVNTTPEELVQRWRNTTPERFELTIEDLLALPASPPIVAEGYGFTPDLVRPLLTSPRQAVWLISTEAFKREIYQQRGKGGFPDTSDPQRARDNHMKRDLLLADLLQAGANQLGLAVIEVDGSRSLEEMTVMVENYISPYVRDLWR
jgi:hypothetical protein